MKLLFEIDYKMDEADEVLENFFEEKKPNKKDKEYIDGVVRGTLKNLDRIDGLIENHSKDWKINRFSRVDLTVLRLATFELEYTDTPISVVINEAVELAKRYGSEKSGSFVNGILSGIVKQTTN
jgi:N utilization substance protein B